MYLFDACKGILTDLLSFGDLAETAEGALPELYKQQRLLQPPKNGRQLEALG